MSSFLAVKLTIMIVTFKLAHALAKLGDGIPRLIMSDQVRKTIQPHLIAINMNSVYCSSRS